MKALPRGSDRRGEGSNPATPVLVRRVPRKGRSFRKWRAGLVAEVWLVLPRELTSRPRKAWHSRKQHQGTPGCPLAFMSMHGGSTWVHMNRHRGAEVRDTNRQHWDLCYRMWFAFEVVAEHALRLGARVFIEWPRGCSYWREPRGGRFLSQHGFIDTNFDGCMYGLKALGHF